MTDREDYQAKVRALREAPKPRRLSLSDILGMVLSKGPADHDRVALGRSARGETTIEVEVRTRDEETVIDAERRAVEVYERLRARFPMSSGYVGANGGESA